MKGEVVLRNPFVTYDGLDALRRFIEAGVICGCYPDPSTGIEFPGVMVIVARPYAHLAKGRVATAEETLAELDRREPSLVARWN